MKRRVIVVATLALYAILLGVTWEVGTRQAAKETEAQLDNAILEFRDTVGGAIDTMLDHAAKTAVRKLGAASSRPIEEMSDLAHALDIDEVNVVSRAGEIVASNDPRNLGMCMAENPVTAPFMALTNGVATTISQRFRPNARNPEVRAKYLAATFPGGEGFVQVGMDERRLSKMLPTILGYIFDRWLIGEYGFVLCADAATGRLVSNSARHRSAVTTLAEAGFDPKTAKPFDIVGKDCPGTTFSQRLFGEKCYCRTTRNQLVAMMATLLAFVLGGFAFFLIRILLDSDRFKAFYAAEAANRAKDMEIAKTIQTAALPGEPPASPNFRLSASTTPAREVGGDFYDFFPVGRGRIAVLVADVSGKGITAALYMMTAKTLIKDTLQAERDVAVALTKVNADLSRNNPANMFLTAWVGVLDLETGMVEFVNAGHNPPIVRRANGSAEWITDKSGPVLAFMEKVSYRSHAFALAPGDTLFLYTDGVTEAMDTKEELFGDARLMETFTVAPSGEPDRLCSLVRTVVTAFAAGMPPADDLTVLAVEYVSRPQRFVRSFAVAQEGIRAASAFLDETLAPLAELVPLAAPLHVILDEIASNIVKHSGASGFEVDIEISEKNVKLTFVDDGKPYDPLAHADPDTSARPEQRAIGGLGILMVKKLADSIGYAREHNRNFLYVSKSC